MVMTVKELKKKLREYSDDTVVLIGYKNGNHDELRQVYGGACSEYGGFDGECVWLDVTPPPVIADD